MARVARVGLVEVLDVVHSRAIGVALPAPGLVLVDLIDLHRLEHQGLLGPVEPHMDGAWAVAQDDRGGASQHDESPASVGLEQHALDLAADRVGGRLGQDHAAGVRQAGQPTRQKMPFCALLAAIADGIVPEQNGGSRVPHGNAL